MMHVLRTGQGAKQFYNRGGADARPKIVIAERQSYKRH
jgi:hypothetical protein